MNLESNIYWPKTFAYDIYIYLYIAIHTSKTPVIYTSE